MYDKITQYIKKYRRIVVYSVALVVSMIPISLYAYTIPPDIPILSGNNLTFNSSWQTTNYPYDSMLFCLFTNDTHNGQTTNCSYTGDVKVNSQIFLVPPQTIDLTTIGLTNGTNYYGYYCTGNGGTGVCSGTPLTKLFTITYNSGGSSFPPTDTRTRITYVYPPDGATVATGTVPIEIKGYLNSQDATSSVLQLSITSRYNVYGNLQPSSGLLPGGVSQNANNYPVNIFNEIPLSGPGNFDVVSSTTISSQGIVDLQATIVPSNSFGAEIFWGTTTPITATTTSFIVGTSTQADYIASYISNIISKTTDATTTFPDCTLLSSDFIPCVLVPPLPLLNAVFIQFHDDILARWPIGIATRLFDIMATTSTSTLPTISIITPHALGPLGDYEWDLNFEAMLSNSVSNPFLWTDIDWGGTRGKDGSTIWQVIGPIYSPIIYAFGLIALASFIMWRHNKH